MKKRSAARSPVTVGVANHNGWAVLVSVSVREGMPVVVDRRRVELIEAGLPNQPYEHDTAGLDAASADELVREVRESAVHCAERALARLRSSLETAGELAAVVQRDPVLPELPASVAVAHASSYVMARADSMMYHDALCRAASALGIPMVLIPRGEERRRAAEVLGIDPDRLEAWLAEPRRSLGPPWQKDHRDAMARAIAALG